MSVPPPSFQHPGSPPPRPELPEGVHRPEPSPSGDALPRWPLWAPFAGMLMTLLAAVVAVGVIAVRGGARSAPTSTGRATTSPRA